MIYISKDDLFSVNDHLNVGRVNGAWANEEFDYSQVRLLSFFDPSSVKINLNTGLFHNIRNLAVKTNYAVYTDRQATLRVTVLSSASASAHPSVLPAVTPSPIFHHPSPIIHHPSSIL